MVINIDKSMISLWGISEEKNYFAHLFPFQMTELEQGLKYLGFFLKPNQYKKYDC
jgi:hypothetical protein